MPLTTSRIGSPVRLSHANLPRAPRALVRTDFRRALLASGCLGAILLLSACGGGSNSSTLSESGTTTSTESGTTTSDTGDIVIALTDAEGDFSAYDVTVASLRLVRIDGTAVETVPLATRVDFSQLTEVTEFFNRATVPAGVYDQIELNLDFSDADIVVQDASGADLAATVLDASGTPVDELTVEIELLENDRLLIGRGSPAALSLDFDLAASNVVDLGTSPPTVTVAPLLLATPELETDRTHRLRGLLIATQPDLDQFELAIRPFRHRDGEFGELSVQSDAATTYLVNGESLEGAGGLAALSALEARSPVVVSGQVVDDVFTASAVLAGDSVPWVDGDAAHGTVLARSGDALTLSGAWIDGGSGAPRYRGELNVLVGIDTAVTALHRDANLGTVDLSVGSRVAVFGELTDDVTLDAREGRVRLESSTLAGQVVSADPLQVDLAVLGKRRAAAFDFSGTGVSAAEDADPANYEIDIATPLLDVATGDIVRLSGRVTPFGFAAPDFAATTVVDLDTDRRRAHFRANWQSSGGSASPFGAIDSTRIDLDLSDARTALKRRGLPGDGGVAVDAMTLSAPAADQGAYAVRVRGSDRITALRSFAELIRVLTQQLEDGLRLVEVHAHGAPVADAAELVTHRAGFLFAVDG